MSFGMAARGYRTVSFEREDNGIFEDFLSEYEYFYAISVILRLVPGKAFCWFAPTCSSWSWPSRSRTCRSFLEPYGAPIPCVVSANCMVSRPKSERFLNGSWGKPIFRYVLLRRCAFRLCLLCLLCAARGITFVVEQPRCSLLRRWWRFQNLLGDVSASVDLLHNVEGWRL